MRETPLSFVIVKSQPAEQIRSHNEQTTENMIWEKKNKVTVRRIQCLNYVSNEKGSTKRKDKDNESKTKELQNIMKNVYKIN